jgi:hypothetical protein
LRKGPNIAGIDPLTGNLTRLFHPRSDTWNEHFVWEGTILRGTTAVGRTTIVVLDINDPDSISVRQTLSDEGMLRG